MDRHKNLGLRWPSELSSSRLHTWGRYLHGRRRRNSEGEDMGGRQGTIQYFANGRQARCARKAFVFPKRMVSIFYPKGNTSILEAVLSGAVRFYNMFQSLLLATKRLLVQMVLVLPDPG